MATSNFNSYYIFQGGIDLFDNFWLEKSMG